MRVILYCIVLVNFISYWFVLYCIVRFSYCIVLYWLTFILYCIVCIVSAGLNPESCIFDRTGGRIVLSSLATKFKFLDLHILCLVLSLHRYDILLSSRHRCSHLLIIFHLWHLQLLHRLLIQLDQTIVVPPF